MNIRAYWYCLAILVSFLILTMAEELGEAGLHTNSSRNYIRQDTGNSGVDSLAYSVRVKAILMLKDQQTFCQATMLSNNAAVLAADCFDYDGNGNADTTQYGLAVETNDANVVQRAQITNITPHPNYDSETFANNIAVIRFNDIQSDSKYYICNIASIYSDFMHVHFSLNADNTQWNEPKLVHIPLSDQNACGAASTLFQSYASDYICTVGTVPSMFDGSCVLPYKFIMGTAGLATGMLGFYSHSSVEGDNPFCNGNQIYNYYIVIANYISWINLLIDPGVTQANKDGIEVQPPSPSYSMNRPSTGSSTNSHVFSLYKFGNVLPKMENSVPAQANEPVTPEKPKDTDNGEENDDSPQEQDKETDTVTEIETEKETKTETEKDTVTDVDTETTTDIITTTANPITETSTVSITSTEQLTSTMPTTQTDTTTSDHTITISETSTTTATDTTTATTTEIVTTTVIQSFTGTLTSLLTTSVISESECPVVTCDSSVEVSEVTVTETTIESSVEIQTVTITELENLTDEVTAMSLTVITITISQPPETETVTQTVASDQSIDPVTVTSVVTETLVVSETNTESLEGDIESVFATVTVESTIISEKLVEPEPVSESEPESGSESDLDSDTNESGLKPWMIGLIVAIIIGILLIMGWLGYIYYRWKKRQREQYLASLVRPASYPQEYLNPQFKEKGYDGYSINGYTIPEERRSRYNSKGSYAGYI